jgi:Uncharacterized proteins of the AP superfamily
MPLTYAGKDWTLLRPESAYPEPDSVAIEGAGNDFLFPHHIPAEANRAANWIRGTPFIDEVTVAFALEGVKAMNLGAGPATDVLSISLSATDAINHRLGPDSREAHDQVLRTDRLIGIFLDSLFRLRDSSRVVVVLAADHGFTSIPELAPDDASPHPLRTNLEDALHAARVQMKSLNVDTLALDVDEEIVLVDRRAFDPVKGSLQAVLDQFVANARQTPGVRRIDRLESLRSKDTLSDPVARRWVHEFPPGTNVELVATLDPGSLWTWTLVAAHSSGYDIDSHIPIIFYGPGFAHGKFNQFVRSVDIAPTLARRLHVKPLENIDGVPLLDALK